MNQDKLFDAHVQNYYCYHDIEICPTCGTPFAQYEAENTALYGRVAFCTDACFKKAIH